MGNKNPSVKPISIRFSLFIFGVPGVATYFSSRRDGLNGIRNHHCWFDGKLMTYLDRA